MKKINSKLPSIEKLWKIRWEENFTPWSKVKKDLNLN